MILKWLITGFIVITVYRWFIKPQMVGTSQKKQSKVDNDNSDEGEYIDYEEVD